MGKIFPTGHLDNLTCSNIERVLPGEDPNELIDGSFGRSSKANDGNTLQLEVPCLLPRGSCSNRVRIYLSETAANRSRISFFGKVSSRILDEHNEKKLSPASRKMKDG
jgi:hypothetical protein